MRRALALAIVFAIVAVARAAGEDGSLVATPTIGVSAQQVGVASSASFVLSTPGGTNVVVDHLAHDPVRCPDPAVDATTKAGFTVTPASPHTTTVACPATAQPGMRRCLFNAVEADGTVQTSFLGVCVATSTQQLAASTSMLTFANVPVGALSMPQTVTITNNGASVSGKLQLQIDHDLEDDYVIGAPCAHNDNGCDVGNVSLAHGASVDLAVYCQPSQLAPPDASLWVTIGGHTLPMPVQLSCSGVATSGPAIHVTPATLDAGPVEVTGTATAIATVHVENVGATTLTLAENGIAISGAGNDWTYDLVTPCGSLPCDLAPGQVQDIRVRFDPSELGARNATMQITSNAMNGQAGVALLGTGLGAMLEDLADPPMIDLGLVPKNGSASVMIHLLNRGNRDLTDASVALSPTVAFSTSPANPITVPYLSGQTVLLTCTPNGATSTFMTTFTASAPDTVNNTPITIGATCTGTDAALVASPSSIALGEIRTGTTPSATMIALRNVSSQPLVLASPPMFMPAVPALSLAGPGSLTIPALGQQQVAVSVTAVTDTDLSTSITASDDADSGYTLQVPVTGKIVTAAVTVPASVELGTFCVNQPTTPGTIELISSGTARIKVPTAPQLALQGASPFVVATKSPVNYPALLAPSESALVDVTPKRKSARGEVSDTLQWATDVAQDPTPTTAVSATFLDDGAAIAPASLDFGQVAVHLEPHDAMPVTIQNCSSAALSLTAVIDQPFAFDNAEFPPSLMPGQTASFGVSFQPTKVMRYDGFLRISTTSATQPSLTVQLSGEGVAAPGGPDAGTDGGGGAHPTSFYACTCNGTGAPVRGWPVAFAIAAVIARRRRGSSSPR
jgi:hypothetical protein